MFKKVWIILISFSLFFFSLITLMPKENIYFFCEQYLHQSGVVLSDESIEKDMFSVSITNTEVYYQNKNIGTIKSIKQSILIFFNKLELLDIYSKESKKIDRLLIFHHLLSPRELTIEAWRGNNKISGIVNLKNKSILFSEQKELNLFAETLVQLGFRHTKQGFNYAY